MNDSRPACKACGHPTEAAGGVCRTCKRLGGLLAHIATVDLRGGLCAEVDPELFYPERGGSAKPAKRLCLACDLRPECLQYALEADEQWGIWGGTSERERRKIRKQSTTPPTTTEAEAS